MWLWRCCCALLVLRNILTTSCALWLTFIWLRNSGFFKVIGDSWNNELFCPVVALRVESNAGDCASVVVFRCCFWEEYLPAIVRSAGVSGGSAGIAGLLTSMLALGIVNSLLYYPPLESKWTLDLSIVVLPIWCCAASSKRFLWPFFRLCQFGSECFLFWCHCEVDFIAIAVRCINIGYFTKFTCYWIASFHSIETLFCVYSVACGSPEGKERLFAQKCPKMHKPWSVRGIHDIAHNAFF